MRKIAIIVGIFFLGCGKSNTDGGGGGGGGGGGLDGSVLQDGGNPDGGNLDGGNPDGGNPDGGTCRNTIERAPMDNRMHVAESTDPNIPSYPTNPPVGGNHFARWARWQIHTLPNGVPRGYWVHNIEHGGVIFLYKPSAPQAIKDALVRVYNAIPAGGGCTHNRALLTADPLLPAGVTWAVVASSPELPSPPPYGDGYVIKSDCIESEQALVNFAMARRGQAVEDLCDQGDFP